MVDFIDLALVFALLLFFCNRTIMHYMDENVPININNAFRYGAEGWLPHFVINWFLNHLSPSGASDRQRLMRSLALIERLRARQLGIAFDVTPQVSPRGKKRSQEEDDPDNPTRRDKGRGKRSKK